MNTHVGRTQGYFGSIEMPSEVVAGQKASLVTGFWERKWPSNSSGHHWSQHDEIMLSLSSTFHNMIAVHRYFIQLFTVFHPKNPWQMIPNKQDGGGQIVPRAKRCESIFFFRPMSMHYSNCRDLQSSKNNPHKPRCKRNNLLVCWEIPWVGNGDPEMRIYKTNYMTDEMN